MVTSHASGHTITLIFSILLLEAKVSEHNIGGGEDQVQTGQPLAGTAEELPDVSPHLPVDRDVEDWVDQTAANSSYSSCFFAINVLKVNGLKMFFARQI